MSDHFDYVYANGRWVRDVEPEPSRVELAKAFALAVFVFVCVLMILAPFLFAGV